MSGVETLLHITTPEAWSRALADGEYSPESLSSEGFVHLSTSAQVVGTANRFFAGRRDLLVLEVDPGRLRPELRWEDPGEGQAFPHLYGPLAVEAVLRTVAWGPDPDGVFREGPY